jgi:hypothetical protein
MQNNQTNLRHAEATVEAELSRLSAKIFSITGKDPKQSISVQDTRITLSHSVWHVITFGYDENSCVRTTEERDHYIEYCQALFHLDAIKLEIDSQLVYDDIERNETGDY